MTIRYPTPLQHGDRVGVTACSAGVPETMRERFDVSLTSIEAAARVGGRHTLSLMATPFAKRNELDLHLGHDELVVRDRYEVLGILDDLLIAVCFIVGSILFFDEDTATAGTWLFLLGSVMMLVRPLIGLTRRLHLRRFHPDLPRSPSAALTND